MEVEANDFVRNIAWPPRYLVVNIKMGQRR